MVRPSLVLGHLTSTLLNIIPLRSVLPSQDFTLHPELLPANVKDNILHAVRLLNQDVDVVPVHDNDNDESVDQAYRLTTGSESELHCGC